MRFLLAFLILLTFATTDAWAADFRSNAKLRPHPMDRSAWPWGLEMAFPWATIPGVWAPKDSLMGSYYVFKVSKGIPTSERVMKVIQYNPVSCAVVAVGAGYETNRVIYASMTTGRNSFDIAVRAFDPAVLSANGYGQCSIGDDQDPVIVLTLYSSGDHSQDQSVSFEMEKLDSTTSILCK